MSVANYTEGPEIAALLRALSSLECPDEADRFLRDLCSTKEIEDLAQRLSVAQKLREGQSYVRVIESTGASSTTVSRVSKCLKGEAGGYRLVLERLERCGDLRDLGNSAEQS